ncbi:MAG: hypothetical protein RI973_1319 [Bacteroidota bacterium]|jgi:glycosyltransferase involved in cell wall biosynthesis
MRIAILADALDFQNAGIHYYLKGLLSAISADLQGHEVMLVRPGGADKFPEFRELTVPGDRWTTPRGLVRVLHEIPALLKKEKVEVVIEPAHFGPFNLPPEMRRITIIHDLTPVILPEYHPFYSNLAHRLLLPGILRKADQIIVNSENTGRDLTGRFPFVSGKVTKVSPARDNAFHPRKNSKVLQKYGISSPYILTVGTIEPRKNLNLMLKAFEKIRLSLQLPIEWVIAGGPGWKNNSFYEALEKSPAKKDVRITGYAERADLPALYSSCEVFAYPSHYEGFGLPALEAMACSAPVLLSGSSSMPEVGGEAALYFNPGAGSAELEVLLAELLNDTQQKSSLSQKSLERAATFSPEITRGQFFQAISKSTN